MVNKKRSDAAKKAWQTMRARGTVPKRGKKSKAKKPKKEKKKGRPRFRAKHKVKDFPELKKGKTLPMTSFRKSFESKLKKDLKKTREHREELEQRLKKAKRYPGWRKQVQAQIRKVRKQERELEKALLWQAAGLGVA